MNKDIIKMMKFDQNGLLPVIIQDANTKEILMFAFMNDEALDKTLKTGYVHFYSRSRKKLWKKGEESGHLQMVRKIYFDCDADVLLIKIKQIKAACHTGFYSCFYREIDKAGKIKITGRKVFEPDKVYGK